MNAGLFTGVFSHCSMKVYNFTNMKDLKTFFILYLIIMMMNVSASKMSASAAGNDGKVGQTFHLHSVKCTECLRFTQRVQQNKFEKNKQKKKA